uniref:uncharacterized protein LOC117610825 n=1 Tax=Osmia lignaria TaxID=473952 RepID=UPI0014796E52|nr:uncharacterized protein LOC117610825 [Osmia lignaria]
MGEVNRLVVSSGEPPGSDLTDCKERWKNIRNGFVRSLKQPPSESSAKQKKQYYLHDVMQFVLPYVKPVAHTVTTGNLPNPSHDNKLMDEINEIKPCDNEVDKAFVNYLQEKKKPNNEDHRKMFLVSLLPEVNKLSDEQMREFKIKVVMLLDEILTRPRQDQASTQQIVSRNQIRSE